MLNVSFPIWDKFSAMLSNRKWTYIKATPFRGRSITIYVPYMLEKWYKNHSPKTCSTSKNKGGSRPKSRRWDHYINQILHNTLGQTFTNPKYLEWSIDHLEVDLKWWKFSKYQFKPNWTKMNHHHPIDQRKGEKIKRKRWR